MTDAKNYHARLVQTPPRPIRKSLSIIVIIGAVLMAALVATAGVPVLPPQPPQGQSSAPPQATTSPEEARRGAGYRFLEDWVDADGRVVRRDQGGDTVSEGQAYGMLIALGVADEERFDSIWTWTRQHLQRPEGLLAWRWSNGSITDAAPAADADLDTARALAQAGITFKRPDLTDAAKHLADNVLTHLSAATPIGRVILPGLWAATNNGYSYNPSYVSPVAFDVLAKSTGDPRWIELQTGARAVTSRLLPAHPVPPDWAQITADGTIRPLPGPAGQGPPAQYGYDASRLPIRLAESCTEEDIVLAAAVAPALNDVSPLVATLNLDGQPENSDQNAVSYTARAAARAAAGDYLKAREDLDRADDVNSLYPTYYGSAWIALARDFLDSPVLGGCPLLAGK